MPSPTISRSFPIHLQANSSSLPLANGPTKAFAKADGFDNDTSASYTKHYAGLGVPHAWIQTLIKTAIGFKSPLYPAHLGDVPKEGHDVIEFSAATDRKQYIHAQKHPEEPSLYVAEMVKNDDRIVAVLLRKSGQTYVPLRMEDKEGNSTKFGMLGGGRESKEKARGHSGNSKRSSPKTQAASSADDELADAAAAMTLSSGPHIDSISADTDDHWKRNRGKVVANFSSHLTYVKQGGAYCQDHDDVLFRIAQTTPHKDRATLYVNSEGMVLGLAELEKPSRHTSIEKYKLPFTRNLISLPGSSSVGIRLFESQVNLSAQWRYGGKLNLNPLNRAAFDFHYAMGARPTEEIDIDEHDFDEDEDILMHFDPAQHPQAWAQYHDGSWYHIASLDRQIYSGFE